MKSSKTSPPKPQRLPEIDSDGGKAPSLNPWDVSFLLKAVQDKDATISVDPPPLR
jgi:hypothetical protein